MADARKRQMGARHPPAMSGSLCHDLAARIDGLPAIGIETDPGTRLCKLHRMKMNDVTLEQHLG